MSEWYDAESADIDVDKNMREVNILVTSNYNGNVYVTITFDQVATLYKEITASQP